MRTPMSLRVATLLALASSGCYSIVNPDKIKPTAAALCATVVDALLAKSAGCFHSPRAWIEATGGGADCAAYDRAVAAGRLQVDPRQLDPCVADIAATDCLTLFAASGSGPPGACAQLVVGTVQVNGSCYLDNECASGGYCGGLTCPGTCTRYGATGDPCGTAAYPRCGPTLTCLSVGAAKTCESYLTAGADCSLNTSGCGGGLACDTSSPTPSYKCVAALGASCAGPGGCPVPGLVCVGYTTVTAGVCRVAKSVGDATCIVGQRECAYGAYCAGTAVGATGTCTAYPSTMNASFACGVVHGELVDCIGGYCSFPGSVLVGACTSYVPLNQPCDTAYLPDPSVQCGRASNGYFCDPTAPNACRHYACTEP